MRSLAYRSGDLKALVVHDGETAGGIPQGNVNSARKVEGGGLATGGGDLSADRPDSH